MAARKPSYKTFSSLSFDEAVRLFPSFESKTYYGHKRKVHSVAWSCQGTKLASGSVDETVHIWPLDSDNLFKDSQELKGHKSTVEQLAWDPLQDNRLATASTDKSVRIWDCRAPSYSGKCTQIVSTTGENINIAWSPDSNLIAVVNKEDYLSIIDTRTFNSIYCAHFRSHYINEISWDSTGKFLFITTGMGNIEVLKCPEIERFRSIKAHTAPVFCLKFDPSGEYFAAGSADASVSLWDAKSMSCLGTFGRLDSPVRTLSFSFDSRYIASGSEDLVIDVSEVSTGAPVHLIGCKTATNTLAWHPSLYLLAYAGDEDAQTRYGPESIRVFGYQPAD